MCLDKLYDWQLCLYYQGFYTIFKAFVANTLKIDNYTMIEGMAVYFKHIAYFYNGRIHIS